MVLIYTRNKETTIKAVGICEGLGERVKLVSPADLKKSVSGLCCGENVVNEELEIPAMYHMADIIVFAGVRDEMLDILLEALKSNGVRIPLKAVVTPFNMRWSLYELIENLMAEHAGKTS